MDTKSVRLQNICWMIQSDFRNVPSRKINGVLQLTQSFSNILLKPCQLVLYLTILGVIMIPELLTSIEKRVGKTAEEIYRTPVDELRDEAEKKMNDRLTFRVMWPLVGRGNVLRNRVLNRDTVERLLDAALK